MRKIIFAAFLAASFSAVQAQNLDDIQEKMNKKKYDEAIEKINKELGNAKHQNNPNLWYYKGQVLFELSKDSTKTDKNYLDESYAAFRKYYELDPSNKMGTLEQNARLFQLYETHYNKAISNYNQQQFDQAYASFKNALEVEEYIAAKGFSYNGFSFPAIDTALILNVAAMANKSNKEDEAIQYYQRLADKKMQGKDFQEIYQLLVEYYSKKGDQANRDKYMAYGKELYPDYEYWIEADLGPLKENKPALFAKYDELVNANPSKYYLAYNYAVELFNYVYANESKPADASNYEPKIEPAIQKALSAQNTPEANLLMLRYLSEKTYKMEDQARAIRGTKPEDVKKKQALNAQVAKTYDQLVPYAEQVISSLTAKAEKSGSDKANLRYATNIMVDYYTSKKQLDKAKEYQDKLKTF
ncbi:MAG TPA: hypothetical protein VHK69_05395 [Chitinophagaceae bacterium]|jgi:CRISPR/Cas system-associated protein Cas5 (RAMP superfamily)|nr:hypothetical protein [Chitinophagaceae bacterium]